MPKYVTTRKEVCAGRLLKTQNISIKVYDSNNNEVSKECLKEQGIINISASSGVIYRGMLFTVNEKGLANDLIYTTPTNYPIQGIDCKSVIEGEFFIDHYVELEELLKYLKYSVDLTRDDLKQIYKRLITHERCLNHHMELFGLKKLDNIGYIIGGTETIPMEIYNNLSCISSLKNGKPSKEEPGYCLIKRRK